MSWSFGGGLFVEETLWPASFKARATSFCAFWKCVLHKAGRVDASVGFGHVIAFDWALHINNTKTSAKCNNNKDGLFAVKNFRTAQNHDHISIAKDTHTNGDNSQFHYTQNQPTKASCFQFPNHETKPVLNQLCVPQHHKLAREVTKESKSRELVN